MNGVRLILILTAALILIYVVPYSLPAETTENMLEIGCDTWNRAHFAAQTDDDRVSRYQRLPVCVPHALRSGASDRIWPYGRKSGCGSQKTALADEPIQQPKPVLAMYVRLPAEVLATV